MALMIRRSLRPILSAYSQRSLDSIGRCGAADVRGGYSGWISDANSSESSSFSTSASSYNLGTGPSYMRGVMFSQPNQPLSIEDFEMPRPKANEILVKTKDSDFDDGRC